MKKPRGYWTKEKCQEESLKYDGKTNFRKYAYTAYKISKENNWLDIFYSERKSPGHWTYENCKEESLKYKHRIDFLKKSSGAYKSATINNWLNEICSHMEKFKHISKWTFEICKEIASKYKTKKDFRKNNQNCYCVSCKNLWIDKICSHMIYSDNTSDRCIYSYKFPDNHIYIGLTNNTSRRKNDHKNDNSSQVFKYTQLSKLTPEFKQLTDYINVNDAKIKEYEFVKKYENEGWIILNDAKPGSIGCSNIYWTKEKCAEEASKYKYRIDFAKNSASAYSNARRKWNCLDEICSHMIYINIPKGYWNKEKCQEEALKYMTKMEFFKKSRSAYEYSKKCDFLNEITYHMEKRVI